MVGSPVRRISASAVAPALLCLVVLALHLALALRIPGPGVFADEAGYIGNARLIAGTLGADVASWPMDDASYYPAGYSALLVPAHLATDDPRTLYALVVLTNALLLTAAVPLFAAVASRVLGAPRPAAWAGAAVAGLAPALAVHTAIGWAEAAAVVLWPATILALHAAVASTRTLPRLWFGPALAALGVVHNRFLPLLALGAVVVVAAALRRRLPWSVAGVNLGALVVGGVGARVMEQWLLDRRWSGATRTTAEGGDLLDSLTDPARWSHLVGQAVGHAWYLLAASLGLVAVGAVVAALPARLGFSHPRPHPGPDARRTRHGSGGSSTEIRREFRVEVAIAEDARRWAGRWAVAGTAVVGAVGVAFFGHGVSRADQLVYGRYAEALALPLVALGVAALWPGRRGPGGGALLLGGAALTVLGWGALVAGRDPDLFELPWNTVNTPGLAVLVDGGGRSALLRMVILATAASLLVAIAAARRAPLVAAGLAAAVAVGLSVGAPGVAAEERLRVYDDWTVPEQLAALGTDEICFDRQARSVFAFWGYPFWAPDITFVPVDLATERCPAPFVVALPDAPALRSGGATPVIVDDELPQVVWRLPTGTPSEEPNP